MEDYARSADDRRGAVYTAEHVVAYMLDAVGYVSTATLSGFRLLEPCVGTGAFAVEIVRRLVASIGESELTAEFERDLEACVRFVEISPASITAARDAVSAVLSASPLAPLAGRLVAAWFVEADFLLWTPGRTFSHVVGNPPYLRYDEVPAALLATYKRLYPATMKGRCDLYVPFFEKTLTSLKQGGQHAFICSDRWMKSAYGFSLREFIDRSFVIAEAVDARHLKPFVNAVGAYTSITRIVHRDGVTPEKRLVLELRDGNRLVAVDSWTGGHGGEKAPGAPVVLSRVAETEVMDRLSALPTLEQAGLKIRVGPATGLDGVYILKGKDCDIERDRLLPLVRSGDLRASGVAYSGEVLVNPFSDDGSLVDLAGYPKLSAHFQTHEEALRKRHVARKNPAAWYRTIDRVDHAVAAADKLLVPDVKSTMFVHHDRGQYMPHHNLCYIVDDGGGWDLAVVRAILLSPISDFIVGRLCNRVAGGNLRFQATNIRQLRLPPRPDAAASRKLLSLEGDALALHVMGEIFGLGGGEIDTVYSGVSPGTASANPLD